MLAAQPAQNQKVQPNEKIGSQNSLVVNKKLMIVFSIACIVIAFVGSFFLLKALFGTASSQYNSSKSVSNTIVATPTPMQFREITIPYLREREYKSKLGSLEQISNNELYTSYLANYDSDGLKINGLLTKPAGEAPEKGWPAIVFIHGYISPKQYTTLGASYLSYVDYLARNGFVVFKIDLRGHGESEGQPAGGYFGADYVIDALNARAALQSVTYVNPEKIGFWGHSMAGNILLRSFAVMPEIPAVVIWAGAVYSYTDREKYGIQDSSFQPSTNPTGVNRRRKIIEVHGEARDGGEFWKQMAPTSFLTDLKGALQIHHAIDDPVVSINYSRELAKLLDKTKVQYELFEYQSGGHNITDTSFVQAMDRTVAFYKKYLGEE